MSAAGAVAALLSRDLRAFLRSRSQLYSSVVFPLMLLAILGAGVTEGLDPRNVEDYVTFLVPAMVVMTALFSSTFSSASYYQDRDSGMLLVLAASPQPWRAIIFAKMLGSIIIGAAQALLVLGIAALIPAIDFRWQYGAASGVALVLLAVLLLNVVLAGVAQLLAARIRTMQGFHLLMNLVLFPLLFLSGAFFPLDELPLWLRAAGTVNPISFGVDLLQLALYADGGDGYFGVAVDLAVLGVLAALAAWLGTARGIVRE